MNPALGGNVFQAVVDALTDGFISGERRTTILVRLIDALIESEWTSWHLGLQTAIIADDAWTVEAFRRSIIGGEVKEVLGESTGDDDTGAGADDPSERGSAGEAGPAAAGRRRAGNRSARAGG